MSRREYDVNNIQPIFFAPLTTDGRDVIGGLLPSSDSSVVTYSSNGVRITASPRINFQYNITESLALETKCIYGEFKCIGDTGYFQYVFHLGYPPTSSSYNGGYRMMYCFKYNTTGVINYATGTNRFDDGDIPIDFKNTPNVYHKVAMQISQDRLSVYIDGVKYLDKVITDNWNNWDNSHPTILAVGSRILNPRYPNQTRSINGYIRNIKMYKNIFSDSELENMTL